MASVGPVEFSSAANVAFTGSAESWSNVTWALTNPATRSNITSVNNGDYTDYLQVYDAATALAAIGDTDVVDGIEVEVLGEGEQAAHVTHVISMMLAQPTVTGDNKADAYIWDDVSPPYTKVYGGPTDTWGLVGSGSGGAVIGSDVKSAGFGVAFSMRAEYDHRVACGCYRIRVTVYYTASGGGGGATGTDKAMFQLATQAA